MFESEEELKDLLLRKLRKAQKSISGLHRELDNDDINVHRLVLTGYLKALTEMGMLTEQEIPPAKVYQTSPHAKKNIYEMVGERSKEVIKDPSKQGDLALYALQALFKRPIFLCELEEAGFKEPKSAKQVTGDERSNARKVLAKSRKNIPHNDPCFITKKKMAKQYRELLAKTLIIAMNARKYVAETKQAKLKI